jgi:uncharacterized protein YkwD
MKKQKFFISTIASLITVTAGALLQQSLSVTTLAQNNAKLKQDNMSQPGKLNLSDGWVTAQADLCNSRTVTSPTTVTTSHDGSPYQVWTDFRRGKESINPAACGRQYWLKKDSSHYNNGIKFVYLVDGRGVCIVPFLYRENSDGSLQSLRSAPECNSGQVATRNSPDRTPRSQPSNPPQPRQPVSPQAQGTGMIDEMLNAHNKWRAKVGVPPLRWSNELASYAQNWANQLAARGQLEHRQERKYGENLFMGSGNKWSPTEVVDDWGSEVQDYDYSSNSCRSICGHYTQIVWKETTEVGCGVARSGNREVWVCNYNPHGNRIGRKPY